MEDKIGIIQDKQKLLINKNIELFLFNLFKIILRKNTSTQLNKKIDDFIDYVNTKIIINKSKYINKDYSIGNIINIIEFVKSQNSINAGDIIEVILIYVFSFAFQTDKDSTFGKYIFNNLHNFKDPTSYEIVNMFKRNMFRPDELNNIKELLSIDGTAEDKINDRINYMQNNSAFFNLLAEVFKIKYINIKNQEIKKKKGIFYMNRTGSNKKQIFDSIYEKIKDVSTTIIDKDISSNSIMNMVSFLFFDGPFGRINRIPIRLIRSFLIEVFIYYQNKNSPLMKYITSTDIYDKIPFEYDLKGALVEGRFAHIILAPAKIEPRITKITLSQNNLRECGMFEFGKLLLFNENIKIMDYDISLVRFNYMDYLNRCLGLFSNKSIEEMNLSLNYLKENSEEYISKILYYLKGLKTLNLSTNELKGGLTSFFVVLKKLYRKKKTNLENLNINKCSLDENCFLELGELLKCKYCKLKKLCLNYNPFPHIKKFLKTIRKNSSLTELYLNRNEISNNEAYELMKIISNTSIRNLYLYKNKITSFDELLKIAYRTKIIKDNKDENYKYGNSLLWNLDVSNNELMCKNINHIGLLNGIIKNTSLTCLEFSHILKGPSPNKMKISEENKQYQKEVEKLVKELEDYKSKYIKIIKEIKNNRVDVKNLKHLENEEILVDLNKKIENVIKDAKAKFTVFLKGEARKIIKDKNNTEIYEKVFKGDIMDRDDEFKLMEKKIVNYMILKRSEERLKLLEEELSKRKLIII